MKPSVLPPELSKTVYFTPWAVFDSGFATAQRFATVTVGLLQLVGLNFLFLFIFGEFLKKS